MVETDQLDRLIDSLDQLGPHPGLHSIEAVLSSAELDPQGLSSRIKTDPFRYHRERIVLRDDYEVLVMTWLPGQQSVPHDHGRSICALRVIQGKAEERTYRSTQGGFVEPIFSKTFEAGSTIAGDDAAIHSVHHCGPDNSLLVTVHVYSPPLRDFRQFIVGSAIPSRKSKENPAPVVGIIGGGFCGSMVAANVLAQSKKLGQPVTVHLIDRRGSIGEGIAYGTREATHLLNVPAKNMGAWADRPEDFLDWARERDPTAKPYDFLPRQLYGDYVRETLLRVSEDVADHSAFHVHADEAHRIVRVPDKGWLIHRRRGESIACDMLVLAPGHRLPGDPFAGRWKGPRHRWIANPWQPFAVADIQPDQAVVVIGSGLSTVDVILGLTKDGGKPRTAPIWLLSRTGLLPRAHRAEPITPVDLGPLIEEWAAGDRPRLRRLLHLVRSQMRRPDPSGSSPDWRAVIDGLRPHTQRIWSLLPHAERRRFIRHLRSYWEVHRHRTAPAVAKRLQELESRGVFQVIRARINDCVADQNRVCISTKGKSSPRLEADWVVNCTGPTPASAVHADHAITSLITSGFVRSDPLGLGLETDAQGHPANASGSTQQDIFVVGTLRKAQLWESTAVPELRKQASETATHILHQLSQQT